MTDMHDEVVEAVLGYYDSNQDIAVDCLLYLASLKYIRLAYAATRELEAMERCPECGSKLESYTHLVQYATLYVYTALVYNHKQGIYPLILVLYRLCRLVA